MTTTSNLYPLVLIRWVDSLERSSWMRVDDALLPEDCTVTSAGFLLASPSKDDPWYVIARDVAPDQKIVCGVMRIPAVAVRSMTYVAKDGLARALRKK